MRQKGRYSQVWLYRPFWREKSELEKFDLSKKELTKVKKELSIEC